MYFKAIFKLSKRFYGVVGRFITRFIYPTSQRIKNGSHFVENERPSFHSQGIKMVSKKNYVFCYFFHNLITEIIIIVTIINVRLIILQNINSILNLPFSCSIIRNRLPLSYYHSPITFLLFLFRVAQWMLKVSTSTFL